MAAVDRETRPPSIAAGAPWSGRVQGCRGKACPIGEGYSPKIEAITSLTKPSAALGQAVRRQRQLWKFLQVKVASASHAAVSRGSQFFKAYCATQRLRRGVAGKR